MLLFLRGHWSSVYEYLHFLQDLFITSISLRGSILFSFCKELRHCSRSKGEKLLSILTPFSKNFLFVLLLMRSLMGNGVIKTCENYRFCFKSVEPFRYNCLEKGNACLHNDLHPMIAISSSYSLWSSKNQHWTLKDQILHSQTNLKI